MSPTWLTTDSEQIRSWATSREAFPVYRTTDEETVYTFVHREDIADDHHELSWEEFADTLERNELVFIYRDDDPEGKELSYFGITRFERAVPRTDLDRDELEGRLRNDETVPIDVDEPHNPESPADEVVAMGGGMEPRDGDAPMGGGIVIKEEVSAMGGGTHTTPHEIPGPEALSPADRGKMVVDHAGERVGMVADVDEDAIFIEPHPGVVDRLRARLGWDTSDAEIYSVDRSDVREVTDDQVVLERE